MPFSLSFRGGDGKLFQVLNPSPLIAPTPQPNLVLNGSFEQIANGTWPDNWGTPLVGSGGSTGNVTWDSTVAHSGTHSLKFVGPATGGPYLSQNLSLSPSTRYYLSYWIRGQGLGFTNNSLGIRLVEAVSTCCPVFLNAWWNENGSFDWQKHLAFFKTPADYTQGRLDIVWQLDSGVTAWIDDVVQCEAEKPCPDTYLKER